jgi:methylmalonyl-CoA carboxyltransferase large subunit
MSTETVESDRLTDALDALRQEVARLAQRVEALEAAVVPKPRAAAAPESAPAPTPAPEGLSEELVLVLSAAIAAYLGKRPHIRQIRLLGSAPWAQQGRVTIQASHALSVHHG